MKIELKRIKVLTRASEETHCFEASLYVDGKARGVVTNEGHGGCHFYSDRTVEAEIDAYAKTLPPVPSEFRPGETLTKSADWLIDDIVNDHLMTKEYRRLVKSRVLLVTTDKKLMTTKTVTADRLRMLLANAEFIKAQTKNGERVLNLMPEEEAIALFRATV